jgi:hypothetical protein
MGSYFSKKSSKREVPFEVLERKVDTLNQDSYPKFEKTIDWAKTKHVYSDSFCIHEKYVSWSVLSGVFLVLVCFIWANYSNKSLSRESLDDIIESSD